MKRIALCAASLLFFAGCASPLKDAAGYGLARIDCEVQSRTRICYVHAPSAAPTSPAPLFIVLHGAAGTAPGMVSLTRKRFNELSDEKGFFVAYPQGVQRTWNDCRSDLSTYAHYHGIDDVAFISLLIDRLAGRYAIDRNRVYAMGISNGGFMALRLACQLPEKIRGIAVVAAANPLGQDDCCRPRQGIDVIFFNGTDDPIVPYDGGEVLLLGQGRGRIDSTDESVAYWARVNGCSGEPEKRELSDSDPHDGTRVKALVFCSRAHGGRVALYAIQGGGHTWPGGQQYLSRRFIGNTSRDINACDIIYDFFAGAP
jgi:polyhydroxybutyrate depolymerase